jgi:riboflavin kinase/FMN adenylyltransferase
VQILRNLDAVPESLRHGAMTIGNFDGVHLGHARIVGRLVARAAEVGGPAVLFTFDPHPVRILRPQHAPPPLTWTDRKAELLAELGIDALVAFPTDAAFLQLSAREFFDRIVRGAFGARAVVEGANFFFGHDRQGNVDLLRQFCDEAGMVLEVVEPVEIDGQVVSSSRVRALVSEGRMEDVCRMLTRPYRIRGRVIHGAGRGKRLGYPTANLADVATLLPAEGIYAGRALADGVWWPAAISLGPNPTFDEGGLKVEAHLLDYRGDLYDRWMEIDFLARLRSVVKFASVEDLLSEMQRDVAATRAAAREFGVQDRVRIT